MSGFTVLVQTWAIKQIKANVFRSRRSDINSLAEAVAHPWAKKMLICTRT